MAVYLGNNQVDMFGGNIPSGYIIPSGTYNITENGIYNITSYASTNVSVSANPTLMSKTVDPTESIQTVTPDTGYDGLSQVTVNAIASDYIGSAVPLRDSADMEQHYYQVSTPSGYYSETAIYNLTTYSHLAPEIWMENSTGYVYARHNAYDAIMTDPPGILTGEAYTQSLYQLSTLSAQTYTPGSTSQVISSYQWLTGSQTIAAIPSSYIIPSGTYSVTENGTYDIGGYASVDVSVAGGGGGFTPDDIALRNISGNISGSANCIGSYAFAFCSNLSTVSFPSCTTIGASAFSYCSNLRTASFPVCKTISNAAFEHCSNLSTISFPVCTTIGTGAFANCSNLSTVSFPSCTTIGNYAFSYCSNLGTASFPVCKTISMSAFANCHNLSTVSFPVCKTISNGAFEHCSILSTVSFPVCTTIGTGAFANCSNLSTVSFPSCTMIGNGAFSYCSNLSTASFPVCTSIGASAFAFCSNLSTVSFPSCTMVSSGAFSYCSNLGTASFPVCTSIGNGVFANCYNLLSLYLLGSSRAWLTNQNAFVSTPISNYTTSTGGIYGSIFVPASLYDSYISATNWSIYSARIVSLTDEQIAALG